MLNPPSTTEKQDRKTDRLEVIGDIEKGLCSVISKLMPSVREVRIEVEIEEAADIFSRGVSIKVDDGKLTEVLQKGHGLQRCIVFGLLQAIILNERDELISTQPGTPSDETKKRQTIILAIEEPELYIHPQMQRLVFGVLREFAATDQILYTTHSPMFVDVGKYESVAVVRKDLVPEGTYVCQCEAGVLDDASERKTFQFLSSFGMEQNQIFFSRRLILVEGEEDIIAVVATARHIGLFTEFPEELGITLSAAGNKDELIKFMKLLNAFGIPYTVVHELDGNPDDEKNQTIRSLSKNNKSVELPNRLEDLLGHEGHFGNKYFTKKYFENIASIPVPFQDLVRGLFDGV